MRGIRGLLVVLTVAVGIGAVDARADTTISQISRAPAMEPNGAVLTVARDADLAYLGGDFDYVGWRTGGAAAIRRDTRTLARVVPSFDGGAVLDVVDDGAGGFYAAGLFTSVGGVPLRGFAHIRSDGSIDRAWDLATNGEGWAVARSGSTVFVSGGFTQIGGKARHGIAAVGPTGVVLDGWAPAAQQTTSLAVSGDWLYFGGNSGLSVIGQQIGAVGRISVATGSVDDWTPLFGIARRIIASGGRLYASGSLVDPAADPNLRGVAAIDLTTGAVVATGAPGNGQPYDIQVVGGRLYLAGMEGPDYVRQYDAATLSRIPSSFPYQSSTVGYADGDLILADYTLRPDAHYAETLLGIDPATGQERWAISFEGTPTRVFTIPGWIVVGGTFQSAFGVERSGVAAIDLTTGSATDFGPLLSTGTNQRPRVYALTTGGGGVYVGGAFSIAEGFARTGIASFDAGTGALRSLAPLLDCTACLGTVTAVALDGTKLFLAGHFHLVNGVARERLAAVDVTTQAVLPFAADVSIEGSLASPQLRKLVVSAGRVWLAGGFDLVSGLARRGVVGLDPQTGAVVTADARVYDASGLVPSPAGVYVASWGGDLAELDSTGQRTAWRTPYIGFTISDIAAVGPLVYVRGGSGYVGSLSFSHEGFVAFDRVSGAPIRWSHDAEYLYPGTIGVGPFGSLTALGGYPSQPNAVHGIVAFQLSVPLPPPASGGGGGGGGGGGANLPDLRLSLAASRATVAPGEQVELRAIVQLANPEQTSGAGSVVLTVQVPPGLELVSSSQNRGSGCAGTATVVCDLNFIANVLVADVRFVLRSSSSAELVVTAGVKAFETDPDLANNSAVLRLNVPAPFTPPLRTPRAPVAPRGITSIGDSRANVLRGTTLPDILDGRGGDDRIFGYGGADTLTGGAGSDAIEAGSGNDVISVRDRAKDVVRCGTGVDTVRADRLDVLVGCERVTRR